MRHSVRLLRHYGIVNRYLNNVLGYVPNARCVASFTPLGQTFNFQRTRPAVAMRLRVPRKTTGLFGYKDLEEPSGFVTLVKATIDRCRELRDEALSSNRKRIMVEIFDELSDTICCVADLAECMRNLHPDEDFVVEAEDCVTKLNEIVERFNTDKPMYEALKAALTAMDVKPLTCIDKRVGYLLLSDIEQSGIQLPSVKRERFVELTQEIFKLGADFTRNVDRPVIVPKSLAPDGLGSHCRVQDDRLLLVSSLNDAPTTDLREWGYRAYHATDPEQEHVLSDLVKTRAKLASLAGYDSYADRASEYSMLGSADVTEQFLVGLAKRIKPVAEKDYRIMQEAKNEDSPGMKLSVWDTPYYVHELRRKRHGLEDHLISPYLSLGAVVEGLNNILNHLYSVNLECVDPEVGEVWDEAVYKLVVLHKTEGIMGYIYVDPFARPTKLNSDCHFTIRGGRLKKDGSYQLPIVTLNLTMRPPKSVNAPLLTSYQAENLFHEMGHAMHSILGRTQYQHVTGTRCPTDFAEVPSMLMEYFMYDKRVLGRFAKHYTTGEFLEVPMQENMIASRSVFAAHEMQVQILHALFDLRLHKRDMNEYSSTTDLLRETHNEVFGLPYVNGTAWHHRFSHLVVYGGKYYSYLVARAAASLLWRQRFRKDPLSREMGQKYRDEVLRYGGEKPALDLLQNFLGFRPTRGDFIRALVDEAEAGLVNRANC